MRCPDCKGSKIYQPFFGPEEKCRNCNGIGEVPDATGTVIAAVREEDGVIRFSVTSDGTTGPEWVKRLKKKGFCIGDCAHSILYSPDFRPTNGVTTEIAVLKGMLFEHKNRTTKRVRAEADRCNLTKPNAEVACLIREKFSDREIMEMGLWWFVVMHEPFKDSNGHSRLLGANRIGGGRWLNAFYGGPGDRWDNDFGFVFAVSQASAQN